MSDESIQRFTEIHAQKINIVDSNGKTRLSLFSSENLPDPIMNCQVLKRLGIPGSGILFYNDDGNECGGLTFGSQKDEQGRQIAFGSFTFDAYGDDQLVQVNSWETNGKRNYGFAIYDRPSGKERAYLGRTQNGEVAVRLFDSKENERIRMVIGPDDAPRLEFLNESGEVIYRLPPDITDQKEPRS